MASSGTYTWDLDNASLMIEAFDRCEIRPTAITRDQFLSGIRSLNLELRSWSSRGVNLWSVQAFTIRAVTNQATYAAGTGVSNISPYTVSILDMFWSQIDGGGTGINIDRIMLPMSRTEYDELSNKLQPGQPTQYWFEKTVPVNLTIYQPPEQGYPYYQFSGHLLTRIQDANLTAAETPDIDPLGYDALCAGLAKRLALKFAPTKFATLKVEAKESWNEFADTNREDAPIRILPTSQFFNRDE